MSPEEIEHVNQSWQSIVLMGDTAIQMFYRRLFDIDASAHALFSETQMAEQRVKFMETFGLLVENIGNLEAHEPMLEELGRRHAAVGVEDHHYDAVHQALVSTIESGLGHVLDREARIAWDIAYRRMTAAMRRGAAEVN
ncbi:MAG: hemin receptor [Rhizobiales bacterium]|nr:hemin receptor [Hyphomicrobiales bacterium]